MPLVKIDYVVSFSSEDPDNPASNLLLADVKSKWLCSAAEPSCSLLLQLKSACKIESITIGAYHVALIEVLVGLSEKPNDPFQVLVPSCVLLSPGASRRGEGAECVRSFGAAQLTSASAQRWDRVRLVCSQPYNKHCKYGLAFVHISSSDAAAGGAAPGGAAPAPLRALQLDADAGSSDDEFRPGELFAKHQRAQLAQTTDAQIRQASSQALKNIPDASTKLTKTPIAKTPTTKPSQKEPSSAGDLRADRSKDSLLYTDDDNRPHARLDRVLQRHRDHARPGQPHATTPPPKTTPKPSKHQVEGINKLNISKPGDTLNSSAVNDDGGSAEKHSDSREMPPKTHSVNSNSEKATASQKQRKRSAETHPELGPVCASLSDVLAGAVVAMSGYVNPQRAALRAAALEMGARYLRDWEPSCTHLICAFPNTPKLRSVRAARAATVAVGGAWLEQCRRRRRRLPWRWFATEPHLRQPVPPELDRAPRDDDSDDDTDDEIEKVVIQQGKKRRDASPARAATGARRDHADDGRDHTDGSDHKNTDHSGNCDHTDDTSSHGHTDGTRSHGRTDDSDKADEASRKSSTDADETIALDGSRDSDVAFVRDERVQAQVSLHSDSDATDEDERVAHPDSVEIEQELPALWAGRTFVLARRLRGDAAALLARYIRAYGGLVLKEGEVLEDSSVQYVVGEGAEGACAGARRVAPAWVWRQHARARRSTQ
ncbi:DNA repair protein XRCC1 [Maniola jurtina]|uniref:DNA repair protein XRCC1 n=1 Tax=Maniola jurtina TaxID=191418 RepID=UPI001E68DC18|nr:DNA repair protein XRCC1 [Maniola jurtina]